MLSSVDFREEILHQHILYSKNYMGHLGKISHSELGVNLLCGDKIKVNINIENNMINEINFEGVCCPTTRASASLMTEELKGKSLVEAERLFFKVQEVLTLESGCDNLFLVLINELKNMRSSSKQSVKCLLLPWKTMFKALYSQDWTSKNSQRDYSLYLE